MIKIGILIKVSILCFEDYCQLAFLILSFELWSNKVMFEHSCKGIRKEVVFKLDCSQAISLQSCLTIKACLFFRLITLTFNLVFSLIYQFEQSIIYLLFTII